MQTPPPPRLTTLAACIAMLGAAHAPAADNTANTAATPAESAALDAVIVKGGKNKDQRGRDRVYTREIVNLYKGKEEVETFKGNTVSDLLSGMVGVYSGDARNSGAVDPNIRGVQGQGRIPVTVDGTEQAITVWRGYAGANNRNYVDPNLISSVYVEKGPSLSRDVKSGIGGSVAMKTIDADDIVPEGRKYGLEVKVETSNNSIKQRKNVYEDSVDYRTLLEPAIATGGICVPCSTAHARVYLRYTETLRYPGIFEGAYGFSNFDGGFNRAGWGWKPEYAKNWEVGYIHDLTGAFPKMRRADLRINYFHNKTKNIIDRDENLEFEQFDKQVRTGVELSARFDSGRLFGGLGVLRNIKNEMCDLTFPYTQDFIWIKEGKGMVVPPSCNHGGLSDTGYLASALQPRWSIDADLGARFFGEKLETGIRFHYHS